MSNRGARRIFTSVATVACVLATAPIFGSARAQQADSGSAEGGATTLEQIDVIGQMLRGWQGASDAVYDTPGSVAEIGREAIERQAGARNTADLFRGVAGVDGVLDRQNPGLNVNIRGLQDQGRVNMSVDGARQNFQQSGHGATALAYIDPELIARVEIDKGPTSTAGGAGVIGGVVNFRTLEFEDIAFPGKDGGVRLNTTTGTNAYDFNGSLAAAGKVGDAFEVVAALAHKQLGEYKAGKRGELVYGGPGVPAEFTTQDQWSWLLKAKADLTDAQTLKLTYTGLDAKFGTGSAASNNTDTNKIDTHTVVADWTWTPGEWWADVAAKVYYTRTANDQFRPDRVEGTTVGTDAFRVDYAIDTVGGSLTNVTRFSVPVFDVALTYGGEYFRDKTKSAALGADPNDNEDGFTGSNPTGERGVGGAFARAEFKRGEWLQILLGGRYDRYQMDGRSEVFDVSPSRTVDVDMSGGRFSPTATAAVTPIKGIQFYASYEEGYRPPNIMESILGGQHIGGGIPNLPNTSLKPEVSKTYEAGVNLKADGIFAEDDAFRAKASIYSTRVRNFITLALFNVPIFTTAVNLKDQTRFKGVDLEANYDAGRFYVGGSAAFIDAAYGERYDLPFASSFQSLSNVYLSPKRKLTLDGGLRFFDRAVTVGGRVTNVIPESQFGLLAGTYAYKRYTLLDAYASWNVNENFTLRAGVENIRDVAYVEAMGAPLSPSPGRTFTVGASARF